MSVIKPISSMGFLENKNLKINSLSDNQLPDYRILKILFEDDKTKFRTKSMTQGFIYLARYVDDPCIEKEVSCMEPYCDSTR